MQDADNGHTASGHGEEEHIVAMRARADAGAKLRTQPISVGRLGESGALRAQPGEEPQRSRRIVGRDEVADGLKIPVGESVTRI